MNRRRQTSTQGEGACGGDGTKHKHVRASTSDAEVHDHVRAGTKGRMKKERKQQRTGTPLCCITFTQRDAVQKCPRERLRHGEGASKAHTCGRQRKGHKHTQSCARGTKGTVKQKKGAQQQSMVLHHLVVEHRENQGDAAEIAVCKHQRKNTGQGLPFF